MSLSPTGTVDPGEAGRLFREGNLAGALTAANAAVRRAATDIGARVLLAELLAFSGNIERADVVLDACADLDPTAAIVVAEFRQLLRGETARRQLFSEGRVPEFLGEPTAAQRSALAAIVALRNGDAAEAARLAAEAEAARPHPSGTLRGAAFDDMRDADDLLASCFEVITTTGKYFWIPPERVLLLEFHPAKRPRDLFWRRATMQVADGPDGDVYLPVIYPPMTKMAADAMTDPLRLGRATDWQQAGDGGPTMGLGAVTVLVGEEALTWLEIDKIDFQAAS
jgi:type VI secretion system protein ImpE